MNIGSGLSTTADARRATVDAALAAATFTSGARPDLAIVFATPHYLAQAELIVESTHEAVGPLSLIGCIAQGVVGGATEVEDQAAVAVWLATFSDPASTFHVEVGTDGEVRGWPTDAEGVILLCDPFSFPVDALLSQVNTQNPRTTIVGGLASGASAPGETRLFVDERVVYSGAVGARLPTNFVPIALVSQGCRPIGRSFTVTKAEGNIVRELGGKPPVERIQELFASSDERDRELMAGGLLIGRVIDEHRLEFDRGDFLVRSVVGADPQSGAIAVGDVVDVGETVQFHVRDADTADEDLQEALARAQKLLGPKTAAGALLFTCNGRGTHMFATPNHDAEAVTRELGSPPLAGFFCAGELGPVGGKNFLHGFTASMAVFGDDTS